MPAGISMEGDDELLSIPHEKVAPKRDDWMTNLPPERNVRLFLSLVSLSMFVFAVGFGTSNSAFVCDCFNHCLSIGYNVISCQGAFNLSYKTLGYIFCILTLG